MNHCPSYWIKLFSTLYLHCLSFYTFSPCIIVKTNNPLYTNDIFHLVWYNKLGIVHCTYLGVSDYYFHKYCILLSEDLFNLYKQGRPWWNAALCCISFASSLFAKQLVKGFPEYKGLRQNNSIIFFNILHKFKNSFPPNSSLTLPCHVFENVIESFDLNSWSLDYECLGQAQRVVPSQQIPYTINVYQCCGQVQRIVPSQQLPYATNVYQCRGQVQRIVPS